MCASIQKKKKKARSIDTLYVNGVFVRGEMRLFLLVSSKFYH